MTSPFAIEGPAVISFSGGRTSGLMLRRILDEGLRPDVHVLFANTGKEREETLKFVADIQEHWSVPIHWLERVPYTRSTPYSARYREVTFETASRKGEPFEAVIEKYDYRYLPFPRLRYCTTELKIRVMKHWMLAHGYDHWTMVIGLRKDEPRRVANQRKPTRERWDKEMPLADAGIIEADVLSFWRAQPFDLQLEPHEGNCDLCFLKQVWKKQAIVAADPTRADWWAERERRAGKPFRRDHPTYAQLKAGVKLVPEHTDNEIDCNCTD